MTVVAVANFVGVSNVLDVSNVDDQGIGNVNVVGAVVDNADGVVVILNEKSKLYYQKLVMK